MTSPATRFCGITGSTHGNRHITGRQLKQTNSRKVQFSHLFENVGFLFKVVIVYCVIYFEQGTNQIGETAVSCGIIYNARSASVFYMDCIDTYDNPASSSQTEVNPLSHIPTYCQKLEGLS